MRAFSQVQINKVKREVKCTKKWIEGSKPWRRLWLMGLGIGWVLWEQAKQSKAYRKHEIALGAIISASQGLYPSKSNNFNLHNKDKHKYF